MRVKFYAFYEPQNPKTKKIFYLKYNRGYYKTEKFSEDIKGAAAKTFG